MSRLLLSLLLMISAREAAAVTVSEGFSTLTNYAGGGTAIWNQALGKIHNSLQVTNYNIFSDPPIDINVGDGSDGPFDSSTYSSFGTVVGFTIQIDTSVHPVLNVTHFELDKFYILEPIGTAPLIIRSLSHVKILGEIRCYGEPGGNASGASGGAGGMGRCGGKNGGAGGAAGGNGGDGGNSSGIVTGGKGGIVGTPAPFIAGGGGGSFNDITSPTGGTNEIPGGAGSAGQPDSDPDFTFIDGGAGGGGGSGDGVNGGGGGGGGGGVVMISAVGNIEFGSPTENAVGYIKAGGGSGGNSAGAAGGGGGGGSVQLFSGGTLTFYNTDANSSQAPAGLAGGGGSTGGTGGIGRSWVGASWGPIGPGHYSPTEQSPWVVSFIEYQSVFQEVTTNVFDRGAGAATISNMQVSPSSALETKLEIAGSDDNFVLDDTGFSTTLAAAADKRYVKFRISVDTTDTFTPLMIDTLSFTYVAPTLTEDEFNFKAAGCGRVEGGSSGGGGILLFLAPLLLLMLRVRKTTKIGAA